MSQSNEKTTNNEIEDGEIIVENNILPNKINENEPKINYVESDSEEEQGSSHFFQKDKKKENENDVGKEKNKEKERSRSREFDETKNTLSNNKFGGKKILNNKKEICRFFLKGRCKNGENCNFLHIPNPCRYYNTFGTCTNKSCK